MTTVVIEHVALNDLPAAWRARLPVAAHSRVTVRIEEEPEAVSTASVSDNPLFGLWQDRDDLTNVETYARQLRAPRHHSKD